MPDFTHLKEWLNLPDETKLRIFTETGRNLGLPAVAIEKDFLHQRGLKKMKFAEREQIISSYLEIFDNVGLHANTREPVFVCGQYFPYQGELKFSLVDLGEGFLKKIAEYTKDTKKISNAADAVSWAINGNSTKKDAKGGTGLKNIFLFV